MADYIISSVQNPKVKKVVALQQKSSERRKDGLFVVEGQRELQHCIEAGFELDSVFFRPSLCDENKFDKANIHCLCYEVTPPVYEKMAYRGSTEGVLAVVKTRKLQLEDLKLPDNPLIVVLESVEKPGNLGAVLRSADAASADAVIVCDPLTDVYNPNLIRSSIGAIFSVPCVACTSADCIRFLKERQIQILTAQLQDSHLYYNTDMHRATAIVMGTEGDGLSDSVLQQCDYVAKIPMQRGVDSLNVAAAASVAFWELRVIN